MFRIGFTTDVRGHLDHRWYGGPAGRRTHEQGRGRRRAGRHRGGRTIFLECHGSGGPTVILLSGFGNAGDIWQVASAYPPSVASGVASFTRVCSYDRPGSYVVTVEQNGRRIEAPSPDQYRPARGNAVASNTPVDGTQVVTELHQLLAVAGVPAPFVLVGHSLGGLLSQLYARRYPNQVTGMVLVDPPTPNLRTFLSPVGVGRRIPVPARSRSFGDRRLRQRAVPRRDDLRRDQRGRPTPVRPGDLPRRHHQAAP